VAGSGLRLLNFKGLLLDVDGVLVNENVYPVNEFSVVVVW